MQNGSVAPEKNVSMFTFDTTTGGVQEDVELPLELMRTSRRFHPTP